jgi:translation initiation factor IF-2
MIGSGYERRSESSSHDDATAAPRVRVYEMAKELGIANRELVGKIRALGIEVANHMSHIEAADVDRIRRALDRERQESLVEERLTDTVIRRRSKTAPPLPPKPTSQPVATAAAATTQTASAAAPIVRARAAQEAPPPPPPSSEPMVPARASVQPESPATSAAPASSSAPSSSSSTSASSTSSSPPSSPAASVSASSAPAAAPEPAAPAAMPEPLQRRRVVEAPTATGSARSGAAPATVESRSSLPTMARPVEAPALSASAATATPNAVAAPPQPVLRQISSPVVTGSAATGAFIQLPGMPPRGEAGVPKIEIKDRDEELRRLGRTGLINRAPAGRDRYGRPAFGAPGQRPGSPPRKRVAAAGKKVKKTEITTPAEHKRVVRMGETIAVSDLAQKMGIKGKEVIKKLWALGMMGVNINQDIDIDTATLIATEFGYQIESTAFNEDEVIADGETQDAPEDLVSRAPVVTIMGHVDHGKTSLLDAIRETNVAGREAGGITQHIGAYHVEKNGRKIVFIDTPGHQAFTRMRARGAKVTDIVVLVVSADDGVMPQTLEAIDHARAAKVPIVVAINKIDKPDAQPERVKQQLADRGLLAEDWGGDVVTVPVSAKARQNLDLLLEMILLVADIQDLKATPSRPAVGTVLEAKLDKGRGPVATMLVRNGTLRTGDFFICGALFSKVRAMFDDRGNQTKEAEPSMPVEVIGLESLPDVGDTFQVVSDTSKAKQIVIYREAKARDAAMAKGARVATLDSLHRQFKEGELKDLNVIIKADVGGTAEVLSDNLQQLSNEKVRVRVLHAGVGAITESDVLLASASDALIIGFNVKPERNAQATAEQQKVDIRQHSIIYELIDDIKLAMTGLLEPVYKQTNQGHAEVREIFRISKIGTVAGCFVSDGLIRRDSQVRLLRNGDTVYTGRVEALKRFKNDASEVKNGLECGISLTNFNNIEVGDVIEAFTTERIAPQLPGAQ